MNAITVAAVASVSSFLAAATGHLRLSLAASLSMPVLLLGQAQAPNPEDVGGFVASLAEAVASKNWALVAALGVVAVVHFVRRFGAGRLPWVATDRGGAALVLVTSVAGAIATALVGGAPFGLALVLQALSVAVSAAGGFSLVKKLAAAPKAPAPAVDAPVASPMDIVDGPGAAP